MLEALPAKAVPCTAVSACLQEEHETTKPSRVHASPLPPMPLLRPDQCCDTRIVSIARYRISPWIKASIAEGTCLTLQPSAMQTEENALLSHKSHIIPRLTGPTVFTCLFARRRHRRYAYTHRHIDHLHDIRLRWAASLPGRQSPVLYHSHQQVAVVALLLRRFAAYTLSLRCPSEHRPRAHALFVSIRQVHAGAAHSVVQCDELTLLPLPRRWSCRFCYAFTESKTLAV